ncbi:MAG TPA: efflux transporter outer membrane subunit [Acidobacteriaceae bacterium]|nr:efflux transporter outer membrane subunit [Acidobacteriaceae bacterium]
MIKQKKTLAARRSRAAASSPRGLLAKATRSQAAARATSRAVALFVTTTLAACAIVGPNYKQPEAKTDQAFAAAEPGTYSNQQAQADFWKQFNDETLNKLVDDALLANHDLRIALGHLAEARAARHQSLYDLAPTVTASAGHQTTRVPAVQSGFPFTSSYYDAGFDATWELDLFGRVRRGVEASKADLQGAEANLRDAQVSVIAEVARTYFELRGEQNQLAVARRNVENQKETFQLTDARLKAGRGTELDTSRAQAQLSTTLATIDPLEASVSKSIHRLGVLTGRDPNALQSLLAPAQDLPELPQITPVGNPADMLRRRPDIRVAERQLAADTARIGVAVGDMFPKVTFTGSFGYDAASPSGLGTSAGRAYSIGPGISWAAFDLGRVHAQVAGARARTDTALAQYEKTVLQALEETENSLVTHARTRDQLVHATDAANASATAARLARIRYEGGVIDFLEVLDAERTQLAAEDQMTRSRTDAATSLIAVYKALGGGWESAPLPRYTQASR